MDQETGLSISSVILGELVDKALFIPMAIGLVSVVDTSTTLFSMLALIAGSLCTAAGAFYAANRAKRLFLAHALSVAAITFTLSFVRFLVVQYGDEPSVHPIWWEFVSWALVFVAGCCGGLFAQKLNRAADGK